jgi:hypothetical protein
MLLVDFEHPKRWDEANLPAGTATAGQSRWHGSEYRTAAHHDGECDSHPPPLLVVRPLVDQVSAADDEEEPSAEELANEPPPIIPPSHGGT